LWKRGGEGLSRRRPMTAKMKKREDGQGTSEKTILLFRGTVVPRKDLFSSIEGGLFDPATFQ